ncbi:MAG: hypothetical protein KF851_07400 [Pirellulaceae bacterium]|nr:hypothetical protein [Pirellulaceae bacterium]
MEHNFSENWNFPMAFGRIVCVVIIVVVMAGFLSAQDDLETGNTLFLVGPERVALESPLQISASGVRDSAGQEFCWTKIVGARLNPTDQELFDQTKGQVGDLVHRLDVQMRRGDFRQIADIVGRLDSNAFPSDSLQHGRLTLAGLQSLLYAHRDEAAVRKWAEFIRLPVSEKLLEEYPFVSVSAAEINDGLHQRLLPLFFDQSAAHLAQREILEMWENNGIRGWGEHVYLAALLIAAGETVEAETQIRTWPIEAQPLLVEWALVLSAHAEVANESPSREAVINLENQMSQLTAPAQFVGRYVLVLERTRRAKNDREYRNAILKWLELTADTEKTYPGLAAASLASAHSLAVSQNWAFEARRLGTELRNRFPQTHHGRQFQAE